MLQYFRLLDIFLQLKLSVGKILVFNECIFQGIGIN